MLIATIGENTLKLRETDGSWQTESDSAVELLHRSGSYLYFLVNNEKHEVEIVKVLRDEKKVMLRVNRKLVEVALSEPMDRLLHDLGMDTVGVSRVANIKAPMPGLVLQIMVEVGSELAKDDKVMILEAMKMENVIKAPGSGKVKSIQVKPGQAVDKNQVLIEFE